MKTQLEIDLSSIWFSIVVSTRTYRVQNLTWVVTLGKDHLKLSNGTCDRLNYSPEEIM